MNIEIDQPSDALMRRLDELLASCGSASNKHELAMVLISACIEEGRDTGPLITSTLSGLGFNPRHVGMRLKEGTGNDPKRHWWKRDEDGRYTLHPS